MCLIEPVDDAIGRAINELTYPTPSAAVIAAALGTKERQRTGKIPVVWQTTVVADDGRIRVDCTVPLACRADRQRKIGHRMSFEK